MKPPRIALLACLCADPVMTEQESRPARQAERARGAHLEPKRGLAGTEGFDYDQVVRERVLGPALGRSAFHVVCLPAFAAEWSVRLLAPEAGTARVYLRRAERNLWYAGTDRNRGEPVEVRSTLAGLSAATAELLQRVWIGMLEKTREPDHPMPGFDGVIYWFTSTRSGRDDVSGEIWSPPEDSLCGRLVTLADDLRAFVEAKAGDRPAIEQALKKGATEMLAAIGPSPASRPASRPATLPASRPR